MAAEEVDNPAVHAGIRFLMESQTAEGCWDEPHFTGAGFPGYLMGERPDELPKPGERGHQGRNASAGFMIKYHLYRTYWPLLALGRFKKLSVAVGSSIDIAG